MLFVNIFKTGEAIGIIFKRVNVGFKIVSEIIRNVRRFGRKSGLVPAGNMTFSVGDNFSKRFFTALSFVNEYVTKFDKFAQVGFFLDNVGVVLGASSCKSSVDERDQIAMFDFTKVASFAKFFFNGEVINRKFFSVKAQNSLENKSMFNAVKVVSVDNGGHFRNDESFLHEHGREQLFLHFNGFWKFFCIHRNHLMIIRRQKKRRHSGECRLDKFKMNKPKALARNVPSM